MIRERFNEYPEYPRGRIFNFSVGKSLSVDSRVVALVPDSARPSRLYVESLEITKSPVNEDRALRRAVAQWRFAKKQGVFFHDFEYSLYDWEVLKN